MNHIYKFVACIALLASTMQAYAVPINGKVTDEAGLPVVGAVVVTKDGAAKGVTTDIDGVFALQVTTLPVKLEISFLGYITHKITVGANDKLPLQVQLKEETTNIDEVVVVGYGTQRRRELTGSVSSVSQSILDQPSTSVDALLSGAVAGLNVTQVSGQPGAGSEIRIRGGNSIYASNEPLYVIDGFIFFSEKNATGAGVSGIDGSLNPLASINPNDIESIDVLKDVSAKAIYGSRGANGVILVTTKKGKRGKNTINYQYTIGIDKSAKKLDLMNAKQWLEMQKTYFNNKPKLYYTAEELAQFEQGTNWQDAVLQTGSLQTHELSINGGDDKTRYLISGNYTTQEGIILNSGYDRFSGRLNLDKDIFSSLAVGVTASASRSTQNALTTFENTGYRDSPFSNGIANSLTYALYMPPTLPIYNDDGSYNHTNPFEYNYLSYYGHAANPVYDLKHSIGRTKSTSLQGNLYAQYTIIEGLKIKASAGANVDYITQSYYVPPASALGMNQDIRGSGAIGNRLTDVIQTEALLTYTKRINDNHFIDLLAGYTYQQTESSFSLSRASHLAAFNNLGMGTAVLPASREQEANFHSVLARVNYTLLDRYNLTATYRADKSSRFSQGHQWGYFPSVGLSWNVDNEAFFASAKHFVPSLKLRLTYGEAGNQEIDFNEYDQYFSAGKYNGETAYTLTTLNNKDLKWETTTEYNAGIDAGFWGDKITLVADVYYKETRDLLLRVPAPLGSGSTTPQLKNIGNITNKGFEFALNFKLINNSKLSWSVLANFARNINTITNLGKYANLTSGSEQQNILRVGESVGSFYGYVFDGIVQSNDDISSLPTVEGRVLTPGDVKLRNSNDDAVVTTADRAILGSIQPDYTYGFSTSLTYRNFDFYALFGGSHGNEVYNLLRRYLERPTDAYNVSAALLNAWTVDNPSTTIQRIGSTQVARLDSRFVEDASFLKLRNITLGYSIPFKVRANAVKARVFISARNLYTWTKYKGYDPEVANGVDLGVYPSARSFLAGASITF
ncbi:SusC/RagA family TonB-linked outer membrane protein [Bacteroidia bacterium]|nr:SusC/RagA family TonB-linked outer membrane protein [Bacteroidia bacterium]